MTNVAGLPLGAHILVRSPKWEGEEGKTKTHLRALCWDTEILKFGNPVKVPDINPPLHLIEIQFGPITNKDKLRFGCSLLDKIVNTISTSHNHNPADRILWNHWIIIIVPLLPAEIPQDVFPITLAADLKPEFGPKMAAPISSSKGGFVITQPINGSLISLLFYDVTPSPPKSSNMQGMKYMAWKVGGQEKFELPRAQILFHELSHIEFSFYIFTHQDKYPISTPTVEIRKEHEHHAITRTNLYRRRHSRSLPLRSTRNRGIEVVPILD